jgi:pimeloyl-ACP methyl ester carboxylesterase
VERIRVSGGHLTGEVVGTGPPVLFIHGAVLADAFDGLRGAPALAGYQLMTYRRRGFGDAASSRRPCAIAEHAADAAAVLDHFRVDRAHVVGHSNGACTALQLALDVPRAVHTLALLEPPMPAAPAAEAVSSAMETVFRLWQRGDERGATDAFLRMAGGPDYTTSLDATLAPGWFDRAVADLGTSLAAEFPAMAEWRFGVNETARITQPCLTVHGQKSVIRDGVIWLEERLPDVTRFSLPGATHLLQLDNPSGLVEGLAAFLAAHPL